MGDSISQTIIVKFKEYSFDETWKLFEGLDKNLTLEALTAYPNGTVKLEFNTSASNITANSKGERKE